MVFVPPRPSYPWRRFVRLGPYETDPSLASTIQSRLATQGYSAVQVEKPAMLPYLPKDLRTPIILDTWAYGLAWPLRSLPNEARGLIRSGNTLLLIRFSIF